MKKMILTAFLPLALSLAACTEPDELKDGYQIGDLSHIAVREIDKVRSAIDDYCDKTRDSAVRYAALNLIRLKYPFIPENGICGKQPGQLQSQLAQDNGVGG